MTSAEHREHALLEHLAETDAIDALLDLVSLTDIADALLTYYRSQEQMHDGTRDRATAAVTQWAQAVSCSTTWWGDRHRIRTWLDLLIERATSDWELAMVAAGPLGDFVRNDPDELRWLEERLRRSAAYRRTIRHAWIWNQVPAAVLERFEQLAGVPLRPPPTGRWLCFTYSRSVAAS